MIANILLTLALVFFVIAAVGVAPQQYNRLVALGWACLSAVWLAAAWVKL